MTPEQYAVWMAARTRHGGYANGKEQPEHYIWRSMLARCYNSNQRSFRYYGGRGITVCKRWFKYENFLGDMGLRPSPDHSLDRLNTDKGYTPKNCLWRTRSEQQKNKTSTRRYTNGNFVGTLVECAEYVGVSKELAYWRWKHWGAFQKGQTWRELQKKPSSKK